MTDKQLAEIRALMHQGGGYLSGTCMSDECKASAGGHIAALLAEIERLREIESEFNALVDTP